MTEKIRILMPIEIVGLSDKIDMDSIEKNLNLYVKNITSKINIKDLGEWRLLIYVTSKATNGIGIYKRATRYPSDKEFTLSTLISIPDDNQAIYGLSTVKDSFYFEMKEDKFYILDANFGNYNNLHEYIFDSGRRAIDLAFAKGFVCGGKKIKFQ
jgi:hypothetical protein